VFTRWNQVGGPNLPIIALSRESSSGTYVFFQEHILDRQDYSSTVRLMPATSAIIESAAADRGAIGYVGIGYAQDAGSRVKVVSIKANDSTAAVVPSEASVRSGRYSIARPLFYYTNGTPTGTVKQFIDFCLSAEGQRIVRETGYVPVQ
jgi:phosphate transport system substrate-binding protein